MNWPGFSFPIGAWFFATLIPLVILYFLKLKRPRLEIPSLASPTYPNEMKKRFEYESNLAECEKHGGRTMVSSKGQLVSVPAIERFRSCFDWITHANPDDRVRAELIVADGITPVRYWPAP